MNASRTPSHAIVHVSSGYTLQFRTWGLRFGSTERSTWGAFISDFLTTDLGSREARVAKHCISGPPLPADLKNMSAFDPPPSSAPGSVANVSSSKDPIRTFLGRILMGYPKFHNVVRKLRHDYSAVYGFRRGIPTHAESPLLLCCFMPSLSSISA